MSQGQPRRPQAGGQDYNTSQKGGPAATMQSAATRNEQAGFVSHWVASDAAADQGVTVTENDIPVARLVTESVAKQVL
ncbi:hypothetical protein Peur_055526 [Populus x canadensis]